MSALEDARVMLKVYQDAEVAVLRSKEYWINGRKMVREDLSEIRKGRREYERKVAVLQSKKGIRIGRIFPK